MKQKLFLSSFLVALLSLTTLAQNKAVTNADLEKYKEKRVRAEADYDRQAQQGKVPTREELQNREQQRQRLLGEFARQRAIQEAEYWRYQAGQLQQQNEAYASALANANNGYNAFSQPTVVYGFGGVIPAYNGYYGYGYNRYYNHQFGRYYNQSGYNAFGGAVNYTMGVNVANGQPIGVAPLGTPPPFAGRILIAPPNGVRSHGHFRR